MPLPNLVFSTTNDVYTIQNTGGVAIDYDVLKQDSCSLYVSIDTGVLSPGATRTLQITQDGVYRITATDGTDSDIINFNQNLALLKSLVVGFEKFICENDCGKQFSCGDDECNDIFLTKLLTFYAINQSKYSVSTSAVFADVNCLLHRLYICMLNYERVGKTSSSGEKLLRKIVELYYLIFYLYEYNQATTDFDRLYVNSKYKFNKISQCLQTDIESVSEVIDE